MKAGAWDALAASGQARARRRGEMVYWQGDTAESFFYLAKGRVKVFLSSGEGAEKTLTILEQGSIFGEAAFFDGLPRVSSAKTLADSEIVSIGRAELSALFRSDPGVAFSLLEYLSQTVRMLSAQVDNMLFLQADRRIALILTRLATAENAFTAHCTHEELASLAGVSRVTVSRALDEFSQKGWLKTSYRAVVLAEPGELARYAGQLEN